MLLGDIDAGPGAGITAAARCAAFDREGTKTSDLDPVPPRQSSRDFVEYGVVNPLNVTVNEVRV